MLELRAGCEHCGKALPPDADDARICSYECTFCAACVELLGNVCPNCGGGFERRPVRPKQTLKPGTGLAHHPAGAMKHRPVDLKQHAAFAEALRGIPPAER